MLRTAAVLLLALALPATRAAEPAPFRVHDPATPLRADGRWWLFYTGNLIQSVRSADLVHWEKRTQALAEAPDWAREVAPNNKRAHYWAPDVLRLGDRYALYYSVSEFGKNTSAIALATSRVLDPAAPGYGWKDHGIVIRSTPVDEFNAIDPSVLAASDGRLWMAYGSFWMGIFLIELDPATGLRLASDPAPRQLAYATEIEAPTLYQRGDYTYLFFNEGLCCKGVASTYRVRVGRSRSVTGPYLDDQGRDLREGGGRAFLATDGDRIGPGHVGLFRDTDGTERVSYHYYDGTRSGTPSLGFHRLKWTDDGWPEVVK